MKAKVKKVLNGGQNRNGEQNQVRSLLKQRALSARSRYQSLVTTRICSHNTSEAKRVRKRQAVRQATQEHSKKG